MKYFLYIRGNPGVGKITVARILEKDLGWKVLWFHDLKNAVYNVVKEHRIPRLMDEVTQPVIVTPEKFPDYVREFCFRFTTPELFESPQLYCEKTLILVPIA